MQALLSVWFSLFPTPSADADHLVARLSHKRFAMREKASQDLRRMDLDTRLTLRKRLRHGGDPEVCHRLREVFAQAVEERLSEYSPYPMIDAIWYDTEQKYYRPVEHDSYHGRFRIPLQPYLDAVGTDAPPWKNYCFATKDMLRDWISWGVPDWCMRFVLDRMRERDLIFVEHYNSYGVGQKVKWPTEGNP